MSDIYDVIVVGAGASGMMSAIVLAKENKRVLLIEQLDEVGIKLKASGGGRCNLSNTLDNESFMQSFGKHGRFMQEALEIFDNQKLVEFFDTIGVDTHSPDGFRIFPTTHQAITITNALLQELNRVDVKILTSTKVKSLIVEDDTIKGVNTQDSVYNSDKVVVATGGLGYPSLGSSGDGYVWAKDTRHKVTSLYPAMTPLITKQKWTAQCKADTIAKATIRVDIPKYKKLRACGDLIFTSSGIRGPVVLDFAREITPIFDKYDEVPLLINMTKNKTEDEIIKLLKESNINNPEYSIVKHLELLIPTSVAIEICKLSDIDIDSRYKQIQGSTKDKLIKYLAWTPLIVVSHHGFSKAMVTRGGVSLKDIDPKSMQSRHIEGLYFCGEILDLDGPCGGYNLQWAFASGYLVGSSIAHAT